MSFVYECVQIHIDRIIDAETAFVSSMYAFKGSAFDELGKPALLVPNLMMAHNLDLIHFTVAVC